METIIEKFLEIAIILVAAKFGAELMRRINQPAVIGELVAGIIIGYYGLGLLPHFEKGDVISTLAEIGVVLSFLVSTAPFWLVKYLHAKNKNHDPIISWQIEVEGL